MRISEINADRIDKSIRAEIYGDIVPILSSLFEMRNEIREEAEKQAENGYGEEIRKYNIAEMHPSEINYLFKHIVKHMWISACLKEYGRFITRYSYRAALDVLQGKIYHKLFANAMQTIGWETEMSFEHGDYDRSITGAADAVKFLPNAVIVLEFTTTDHDEKKSAKYKSKQAAITAYCISSNFGINNFIVATVALNRKTGDIAIYYTCSKSFADYLTFDLLVASSVLASVEDLLDMNEVELELPSITAYKLYSAARTKIEKSRLLHYAYRYHEMMKNREAIRFGAFAKNVASWYCKMVLHPECIEKIADNIAAMV
ncbi:MAG: hypothetical protein ACXQS5_03915 [Candidatus Methanospirareceae archaeon]